MINLLQRALDRRRLLQSGLVAGSALAFNPLKDLVLAQDKPEYPTDASDMDALIAGAQKENKIVSYGMPDYWANLLFGLMKETAASDANTLEVYRLMADVDVLKSADQYSEMAQLAQDAGSPGEAVRILQRGFEKNVFTEQRAKEKNQRLLAKAKQASANDQATLEKSLKEADAAPTGGKNAGMGLAYLSYAQYEKAADQFNKAVTKGSLRNPAETQLLLGIADLKSGHKEDAVKAFKAVKGDAVLERLAGLWILHAKQA